MIQEDKLTVWKQKLSEMDHLQDGLGTGLDQGIKETVAVLQLLGVHTRASCEGHIDHGIAAPWIDVESPNPVLADFRRFSIKFSEMADALEADGEVADAVYEKLHDLRKRISYIEALEYKKLIPYLDEFYLGKDVYYEERLIIDFRGRLICQGALLQPAEAKETQAIRLQAYQEEMRDFTEFLKDKFFTD
jgi:hypothetical protein